MVDVCVEVIVDFVFEVKDLKGLIFVGEELIYELMIWNCGIKIVINVNLIG